MWPLYIYIYSIFIYLFVYLFLFKKKKIIIHKALKCMTLMLSDIFLSFFFEGYIEILPVANLAPQLNWRKYKKREFYYENS